MKIAGQRKSVELSNMSEEMLECSRNLMEAIEKLRTDSRAWAEKDWALSKAEATATIKHKDSGKSADIRNAYAKLEYVDEEKAANEAKEDKIAQLELVRALRQKLSALQTLSNSNKAEFDALHYNQTEG